MSVLAGRRWRRNLVSQRVRIFDTMIGRDARPEQSNAKIGFDRAYVRHRTDGNVGSPYA